MTRRKRLAKSSMWLRVRRVQYGFAGGRQLRQCDAMGFGRRCRRRLFLGVQDLVREPIGEILFAAALAAILILLAAALLGSRRATHADMEMVVVAEPGSDLGKPAAVALGLAAQRLLDRGVDKDALHARLLCGIAQHLPMLRCPGL